MSKKSGKEQYLDAKYVVENPNKLAHAWRRIGLAEILYVRKKPN